MIAEYGARRGNNRRQVATSTRTWIDMKKISRQTFLKRVKDAIEHYEMLPEGGRVLIAVSGGADSVCMLRCLISMRRSLDLEVEVAHMDHGIRGRESEKEARFVEDMCLNAGVKCFRGRADVGKTGKDRGSLEEKARTARYDFLLRAARSRGCGVVATGHTLDDQAETVLMKVVHGGSLSGLSGIPPVRRSEGIRIIRPLIRVTREQVLSFLEAEGADHVEDPSNRDPAFRRNRIRMELLPALEKYNPSIRRSLANLSDTLREDLEALNTLSEEHIERLVEGGAGVE
ncbi:MAG: tRNA lysidine(34) synthetase TilS, partial [Candidatus Omnitrophica bacterium]|nr:tRNA lysidine(34) synthetase TilS [Candidatus Omnitrophota bacterium]